MNKEDLVKLKLESEKMRREYPDRVPVIVNTHRKQFEIAKNKYLVPKDILLSRFLYTLRKRCTIKETEGLYLLVNDTMPSATQTIGEIDAANKNESGMLLMTLCKESVFGTNTL